MRIENWCGYDIHFVEHKGERWAVLKDICDALELHTYKVSQRLNPDMLERIRIDGADLPSKYTTFIGYNGVRKTQDMLIVNEAGIYEALYASRRLEARKFRQWSAAVMSKLRRTVGLQGYEVMRMTEPEIQEDINHILDTIYYDDKTKKMMRPVTVQGGDVEQVEFQ